MSNQSKGIMLALLTSVISGFSIFYSKISVAKIDPLVLTTSRNLYVGALFLIILFLSNGWKSLFRLSKRDAILLVLIGFIGGSIPFYLFFSGIKLMGAQSANLIHKSLFIWVIMLGSVFLKEKLNIGLIVGGALIFIGTYFFTTFALVFGQGTQYILLATLMWSVENVIAKKVLSNVSSELVGLFRMMLGGLLLFILTFATGKGQILTRLNTMQLQTIFIGGTLLFFYVFTWYKSLKYAPAGLATTLLTFSLIVGNVLNGSFGYILIKHSDIYSMIFVSTGVLLLIFMSLFQKKILGFVKRFHE